MFIQTESTPNPNTLKFLPGRIVAGASALHDFESAADAARSPLAAEIFGVEGVSRVFFGMDFVAVTKSDGEWQHLKPAILGAIMEHFQMDRPLIKEAAAEIEPGTDAVLSEEDQDIVEQIIELLETRVRPAVAQDGGDITFRSFDSQTGTVYLNMRGACSGCPSSTATLKGGIEKMLMHYIPEVTAVQAI